MPPQATYRYGYQRVAEVMPKASKEGTATLLICDLPEAIPYDTLYWLFSHYGASAVLSCAGGRLQSLGKVLSVEKARPTEDNENQQCEPQFWKDSTSVMKDASIGKDIGAGAKLGSLPGSEPIAEKLGVDYQFPPHLEYAYPPLDGHILTNILDSLIAVLCFYTRVLHLMNKMNTPARFRMALPTLPLPPFIPDLPPPPIPATSDFLSAK